MSVNGDNNPSHYNIFIFINALWGRMIATGLMPAISIILIFSHQDSTDC